MIKNFYLILILYLFTITNSYGYIDPGTGSFIIQTIMAIAASIFFYLGYPIRIIKSFFKKIFDTKKKTDKEQDKLDN